MKIFVNESHFTQFERVRPFPTRRECVIYFFMKFLKNIFLLLLFVTAACSHASAAPDSGWTVDEVKIQGLETVKKKAAKKVLSVKGASIRPWVKKQAFDVKKIESDIEGLKNLLSSEGFYNASIEYSLEENEKRKKVDVIYQVAEGLPVLIEAVHVYGISSLDDETADQIGKLTGLEPGKRLRTPPYAKAKGEIVAYLKNHGRPYARVSGKILVDREKRTASITLNVIAGKKARFGPVQIKGFDKTDHRLIKSRLEVFENQEFSQKKLDDSRRNLFGLGFIKSLEIKPVADKKEERDALPIEVQGEYKKFKSLRAGVGYGTEDQFRVQAGWRHRHFTKKARLFDVTAKYSDLIQSAETRLYQPRFLSDRQELENVSGVKREDEVSYIDVSVFNDFTVTRKIGRHWRISGGHQLEIHRPQDLPEDLDKYDVKVDESYFVSSLKTGFDWNTRPQTADPDRGAIISNNFWWGSEYTGSEVDYFKSATELKYLFPMGKGFILGAKALYSGIQPLDDTETIPLFMRLFAGGSHSVRGYAYQKLGPEDEFEDPIGGLSKVEGSFEVRYPIYKKISGVAFCDAGAIMNDAFTIDTGALRYTAGPGLRYKSPVGALSLDVGFQLNPEDDDEDSYCIHFSVGQAF